MPQDADKLSDAAIEQIATWIAGGAAYDRPLVDPADAMAAKPLTSEQREFWSFRPLETPKVPAIEEDAWCRTPIDRFVLARLQAADLEPNPMADRRTLIRRAYLDLVGLLPTPEEVEAFVDDPAPDAYDRLIDRLLDSPHYGERWARHWLDLARFAESHGYEQDDDRPTAYHYRDFVIQALNDDMPYNQFVRWQIAGDELAPDDHRALMATGFLAAGTHATQITANQVEKERYDELDDMASTIGTSMLGLTIGCARCHDHKFDPISQVDYYRFLSTFTTTVRSEVELDFHPEVYERKKAEFEAEHAPLVEALKRFENEELASRFEAWLATDVERVMPTWLVLDVASMKSEGGAKFTKDEDGAILVSGKNASEDTYTFVVPTRVSGIRAVRLEALAHESLPHDGPGRAENGNFALSDFQVWAAPTGTASPGAPVKLINPKVTYEQEGLPITATIDDNKKSAWAVDGKIGQDHAASFALETPVDNAEGTTLTFILKFQNNTGHNLGRLRFSISTLTEATSPKDDAAAEAEVEKVNAALSTPADQRTGQQRETLLSWYRPRDPEWQKLKGCGSQTPGRHSRTRADHGIDRQRGSGTRTVAHAGSRLLREDLLPQAGRPQSESRRGRPGFSARVDAAAARRGLLARGSARRLAHVLSPPSAGQLDHRRRRGCRAPAGAGHCQPALAAPPGAGHCEHAQRFWRLRRAPHPSATARLSGRRLDRRRLAAQAVAQADHDQRRLHADSRH